MRDASGSALPIFCLVVSQIRHEPVAPTSAESRAAGDVIDRHRHDDHQLIYVGTGVLAIQTERGSWVASYDRAVWIPAGIWHQHRFYGQSSFHTIGFPVGQVPLPDSSPTIVAVSSLLRELLIACTDAELPAAESRRIRAVLRDRNQRLPGGVRLGRCGPVLSQQRVGRHPSRPAPCPAGCKPGSGSTRRRRWPASCLLRRLAR